MGLVTKDDGWRITDECGIDLNPCFRSGRHIPWDATVHAFQTAPR